jgi:hypothetical protein
LIDPKPGRKGWFGRRKDKPADPAPATIPDDPAPAAKPIPPDHALAPPGFHVYRPSSAAQSTPGSPPPPDEDDVY